MSDYLKDAIKRLLETGDALDAVSRNARCYDLNDVDRSEAERASKDWRESRDDVRCELDGYHVITNRSDVKDAVMKAVSVRLHTDTSDYANWQGIRDMGSQIYDYLDDAPIPELEKLVLRQRPPKYRRIIGAFYIKEDTTDE